MRNPSGYYLYWINITHECYREFERFGRVGVPGVVPDGRRADVRRFLRVAETAQAQAAQQSSLHHHQAEPVRDGADEGVPGTGGQADAVVHETVDGRGPSPQRQRRHGRRRYAAQAVQQDGRLRNGHHQTEQPQSGQRAHANQPRPRPGTGKVFLTRTVTAAADARGRRLVLRHNDTRCQ